MNQHIGLSEEEIATAEDFDLRAYAEGPMQFVVQLTGLNGNFLRSYEPDGDLWTVPDLNTARRFSSPTEAENYVSQLSKDGKAHLASVEYTVLGFVEVSE